jgi:hypothetical protein
VSAVFGAVSCQTYRVVGPPTNRRAVRVRAAPGRTHAQRATHIAIILDGAVDGVLPISGAETLVVAGTEARRFVRPTTPVWKRSAASWTCLT